MSNSPSRRIVVIGAHPDDELLGCGGTTALHTQRGDAVHHIIVCEGESIRYGRGEIDQARHARAAGEVLGVRETIMLGFPDQRLDTLNLVEVVTPIERIIDDVRPHVVYCQYGGDVNRDHQLLFQAALVALRPVRPVLEAIYAFETASSTEWAFPRSFVPDTWVDITEVLDKKLRAMACYESEVREYPHPRSLKALEYRARAWGAQVVAEAAEVFMTVRRVNRGGPPA